MDRQFIEEIQVTNEYTKRFSALLLIREVQNKTMKHHSQH